MEIVKTVFLSSLNLCNIVLDIYVFGNETRLRVEGKEMKFGKKEASRKDEERASSNVLKYVYQS